MRRQKCRRGTHECVMPQAFPITDHLHKLWGGPPGPRPAPWPASPRSCKSLCGMSHERVQGDPRGPGRGPGGPPHNLCRIHVFTKSLWHYALVRAASRLSRRPGCEISELRVDARITSHFDGENVKLF